MDAFMANYRPGADKLRLTDKHARLVWNDEANGGGFLRPEIDRGPLQTILLDSLRPGTVIWNSQFTSMTPRGDGWELTFKNGTSAWADLVIAADGANSRIRPYLTPIKPFYSGVTIVEGTVDDSRTNSPTIHKLLNGGKIFALDDAKTLIVSSKGDGSLVFYTGCKTPEYWSRNSGINFASKAQVTAWFIQAFAGWDALWRELFEAATLPFVARPQYCMPLNQAWETKPNLTMLGDAAHLMPPYAGEGVNMAMLDALELSTCLASNAHADVRSALAAYERQMLARFAEVGQLTLEQTASLHSPDALRDMLAMFGQERPTFGSDLFS